jgi:hypothetical protein
MENTRIELYKKREFGDVFNVAFAFIKQEIKPLGRAILVFIVPFILVQGILMAVLQSSMMDVLKNVDLLKQGIWNFWSEFFSSYLLLMVVFILAHTMIFSTITSYFKLYKASNDEITISALGAEIKKCFFPILGGLFLSGIVIMIGFVLCIIPGIYLGVSLSVFLIALVIEQKGIGDAFSRSFQLVGLQWWWTFLLIFVIFILMYIIVLIFQIPAMVFGFTAAWHKVQTNSNPYTVFGPVYIIYTSVISAIQQLIYIIPIILLAFQYFNLVEIRDKSSLSQKINAIGQDE